jgi:hypothetical protein
MILTQAAARAGALFRTILGRYARVGRGGSWPPLRLSYLAPRPGAEEGGAREAATAFHFIQQPVPWPRTFAARVSSSATRLIERLVAKTSRLRKRVVKPVHGTTELVYILDRTSTMKSVSAAAPALAQRELPHRLAEMAALYRTDAEGRTRSPGPRAGGSIYEAGAVRRARVNVEPYVASARPGEIAPFTPARVVTGEETPLPGNGPPGIATRLAAEPARLARYGPPTAEGKTAPFGRGGAVSHVRPGPPTGPPTAEPKTGRFGRKGIIPRVPPGPATGTPIILKAATARVVPPGERGEEVGTERETLPPEETSRAGEDRSGVLSVLPYQRREPVGDAEEARPAPWAGPDEAKVAPVLPEPQTRPVSGYEAVAARPVPERAGGWQGGEPPGTRRGTYGGYPELVYIFPGGTLETDRPGLTSGERRFEGGWAAGDKTPTAEDGVRGGTRGGAAHFPDPRKSESRPLDYRILTANLDYEYLSQKLFGMLERASRIENERRGLA